MRREMIISRLFVLSCMLSWLPTLAFAGKMPLLITGKELAGQHDVRFEVGGAPKASVIVFLSAKCPCSVSHEEALKGLQSEFGPQGFRFVGVHSNVDEELAATRGHFQASALPFPVVQDDGAHLANVFGALKTPHVFVLDPKGALLFQGGVDDSHVAGGAKNLYLRDALDAIREGKSPKVAQARSLGCVIKRP